MDQTPNSKWTIEVPSVEDLRALGRDRLMTHFIVYGVAPPDDVDAMAQAAHDLLVRHAPEEAAKWEEAFQRNDWVSFDSALNDLGILDEEGPPNESAA